MKIKIWGVTPVDRVYTNFYDKVTKYEIEPICEWYDLEKEVEGFKLVIYQGNNKSIEEFSINTTFKYDKKANQLYVEFHDY